MTASRIEPRFVERVWGSLHLEPWFPNPAKKTGEVWFDAGRLLIKFLFTTEALSVQVHPDDRYARLHHDDGAAGKTEMWHILSATPGARIAAGFAKPVQREQVRTAALDGSIEQLLGWHEAHAGDSFFTPAGVVHALGAGLVVCEIQQTSDITYRLFDYGRGRELHLDHGMAVAHLEPHPGRERAETLGSGGERLAACEYFVTERWTLGEPRRWERGAVVIVLDGAGQIDNRPFTRGEVWRVPAGVSVEPRGPTVLLRTYEP